MDPSSLAALVFAAVTAGAVAFQIALALGAPWGAYAMGGRYPGRMPPAMRVVAIVQAAILGLAAAVILSSAGFVLPELTRSAPWLIWLVVAFSAVSVVLNAITPSPRERRVWLPVAVVMLVSSLVVALA